MYNHNFTSPQIQVSYPLILEFWYFLPGSSYKFEVYLKTGRFYSGRIWTSVRPDKVVGKWTHVKNAMKVKVNNYINNNNANYHLSP
jgi:hypothetical protein